MSGNPVNLVNGSPNHKNQRLYSKNLGGGLVDVLQKMAQVDKVKSHLNHNLKS